MKYGTLQTGQVDPNSYLDGARYSVILAGDKIDMLLRIRRIIALDNLTLNLFGVKATLNIDNCITKNGILSTVIVNCTSPDTDKQKLIKHSIREIALAIEKHISEETLTETKPVGIPIRIRFEPLAEPKEQSRTEGCF
jgi:hypothetical protein